jgi:hypothetical protein
VDHGLRDQVGLELARRIAAELAAHPEWIKLARKNLDRWCELNADSPTLLRCYEEWREILDRSTDQIIAVLTAQTDHGQRLRQNSPFADALSPSEVWEVKRRFHAAAPA